MAGASVAQVSSVQEKNLASNGCFTMMANYIPTIAPANSAKNMDCGYAPESNTVRAGKVELCLQEQDTWDTTTSGHLSLIATTLGFKQEMVVDTVTSSAGRTMNRVTVKLRGVKLD